MYIEHCSFHTCVSTSMLTDLVEVELAGSGFAGCLQLLPLSIASETHHSLRLQEMILLLYLYKYHYNYNTHETQISVSNGGYRMQTNG